MSFESRLTIKPTRNTTQRVSAPASSSPDSVERDGDRPKVAVAPGATGTARVARTKLRRRSETPARRTVLALAWLAGCAGLLGCEAYHNEAERAEYKKMLDAQEAKMQGDAGVDPELNVSPYSHLQPGYNPPDPTQCPNNECLPDPGSKTLSASDCNAAEAGLQFLALPIWDFDDDRTTGYEDDNKDRLRKVDPAHPELDELYPITERYALSGYTYADDTTFNYYPFGWEPPTIPDPYARCGKNDNHVFHISGGPFLEWGGGLGRALRCMNTRTWTDVGNPAQTSINTFHESIGRAGIIPIAQIYCHAGASTGATVRLSSACDIPNSVMQSAADSDLKRIGETCPQRDREYKLTKKVEPTQDEAVIGMALDLSKWEGISFWARRGPNSQAGIRLLVGDKRTDDDISFLQYMRDPMGLRYCERTVECKCRSASRPPKVITEEERLRDCEALKAGHADDPSFKCELDEEGNVQPNSYDLNPLQAGDELCWVPGTSDEAIALASRAQYAGDRACNHQSDSAKSLNAYADPRLYGTKCLPYSFRGSITTNICYDPDSDNPALQKPAEASETCGDHWMKSITLGLDWQFYKIPFNELLQQGWAKRSYWLDLTSVTLVRFTWDRGYIDFYIDDVRFYRRDPKLGQ